jgi:general stress protein CsbA
LAGQVRPIRNESGYDVTEQTLYQLYQDIGGTKTVRQLNQVEKRLLRILAVYRQMQDTAKGDLYKTIRSTANQLRVMQQQSRQFATWMGVAFNQLLQNSGILIEINAYLYAASALAKQFAISLGYVEKDYSPEQPIQEMNTELDNANKSVDDLKGKLLGFDKFQVLSSASADEDSADIAKELQKAMDEYDAIINSAENPAFQRSIEILEALGGKLVDVKNEAGEVVGQIWEFPPALTEAVKLIGSLAAALATLGLIALEKKLWSVVKGITGVGSAMTLLRVGGLGLLIYGLTNLITKWDELSVGMKIVYGLITALGAAMIFFSSNALKKELITALLAAQINFGNLGLAITSVTAQTLGFAAAIGLAFAVFANWEYMNGMQRIVSVLGVLTVALLSAAIAFGAFHSAWSLGLAIAGIAAGILAVTAAVNSAKANIDSMEVPKYANGGLADKGSLFYAGEAGPELVTQTSGGGSTIMNMKQLEDAVARGFIRGFASTDNGYENDDTTEVYVDGQRLFNIMRGTAKRNGYDFVRV